MDDKLVLRRVMDRYTTEELIDELELVDVCYDDILDMDTEDFIRVFKQKILDKQEDLDIW